jgi:hypothetical protein
VTPTRTRSRAAGNGRRGPLAAAVAGALGGFAAGGCMTALRALGRRAGLIEKPVPQAVEEWVAHRTGVDAGDSGHQVTEQLLHAAYSAACGAAAGLLLGPGRGSVPRQALTLGLGVWAISVAGVGPTLRIFRSPARATPGEEAVNLAAHLVFGTVTMLVADDLARQRDRRPTSDSERLAARVG